ncbi:efflux RND transporter permease subunit [Pseudoalteromonas sp. MMG024]|uniref:efflux RND transporter permease subunit n=1 Tax=Pseudoalteromonas sp. MMG024 TaxID=2909980 RepID=UPI001F1D091C|nr:efflux RND transporter permease subunit [Pseudoalteromonas sp. MMG024]MCF6456875.1 efflux RND transporter permease subunit [Pseudoalteromonas sp. MMG024]
MRTLIDASLSRTRTVLSIFILLIISGWVTYQNIPKEANPDVTIPFIYVSIVHDGISPEDAERLLVRPMEIELRAIEGVKEMTAVASEGHASVTLEFFAGSDPKEALADVRDKVSLAKAKLPSETEEPEVHEVLMEDQQPTITLTLSGDIPERGLLTLARNLKDELESISSVLEVEIGGEREDMVEIVVDPLLMESYGLDQNDIYSLLTNNNRLVAAGTLDTGKGRFAVKIPSVFETIQDVMEQPVKVSGDKVVRFMDVAQIRRSYKDPNSIARINGQQAVSLEVKKRAGENIIDTVDQVKAKVEESKTVWPNHIKVTYTGDMSKDVKDMLSDLQNNVLSAVLLVVIVIIAILGTRSAFLVGVAIPGSFLTGILVIAIFGLTVNIVVLFALIMAVGMLVDGAIVVSEFADRMMSEGMPRKKAYAVAAKRMAWPIIASTATTLAAFAPLIFWPGMMGEFMKYLPITLIATLSASLIMALVFVPTIGSLIGKVRPLTEEQKQNLLVAEEGNLTQLKGATGRYVRLLDRAIKRPLLSLFAAIGFSVLVFISYGMSGLGVEFFPDVEPNGINLKVRSYGDLSIYEKDQIMKDIEARILTVEGIKTLYSRSGGKDIVGSLRMNLKDWDKRRPADQIIEEVLGNTSDMAGVEIEIRKDENGPGGGKDLSIELSSKFPDVLNEEARRIRNAIENDGAFVNVDDSASKPGIEWQLKLNRADAARFGADATMLGANVQMVTNGLKLGEYRPDDVDDEIDIRVRFPADKRDLGRLETLRVKTQHGQVPITHFIERKAVQKVDTINRVDSHRVVTVNADVRVGQQLGKALPRLQAQLEAQGLDPRVKLKVRGENEEQDESMVFLEKAFLVALFVMGIILVTQFNSFYQAMLILSAVLFSTVGVFLGLIILQQPFGIVMSGIGVISLAGIVVNNNIVLIDTYNVLRRQGMDQHEAILRTGAQRLRPVLLTTVTTILGLMPMVLQINIDLFNREIAFGAPSTQWWVQLATAVAGGLAFATVLTLVLTPCLLALRKKPMQYQDAEIVEHKLAS